MKYLKRGFAATFPELFLGYTGKVPRKVNSHKLDVCADALTEWFKVVTPAILEGDLCVNLSSKASLLIKRLDREEFIKRRKEKTFLNVDFLKSNFTAYQLVLRIYSYGHVTEYDIICNDELTQKLVDMSTERKTYFGRNEVKWKDFVPNILDKFPLLSYELLYHIIKFGLNRVQLVLRWGTSIICERAGWYMFFGKLIRGAFYFFYRARLLARLLYRYTVAPPKHDGYYYFWHRNWKKEGTVGRPRKLLHRDTVVLCRYKELCLVSRKGAGAILRVKVSPENPRLRIRCSLSFDDVEWVQDVPKPSLREIMTSLNNYFKYEKDRNQPMVGWYKYRRRGYSKGQ